MSQPNIAVPTQLDVSEDMARVASYATYEEAQAAVDLLADSEFPVEGLTIVGTDLRSVERVTGRMTKGRAALLGLMSGVWLGLFVGVVMNLFVAGSWVSIILTTMLLGALWGALMGFVGHLATGGKRDFASTGGFVARRYDIMVERSKARRAAEILVGHDRRHHAGAGGASPVG